MVPEFTLETALQQRNRGSTEERCEPSWSLSQSLETDEQGVGWWGDPHTAADTLLTHCGGMRYKKGSQGERAARQAYERPSCSFSLQCVTECV